jgi:hypothetical protein
MVSATGPELEARTALKKHAQNGSTLSGSLNPHESESRHEALVTAAFAILGGQS